MLIFGRSGGNEDEDDGPVGLTNRNAIIDELEAVTTGEHLELEVVFGQGYDVTVRDTNSEYITVDADGTTYVIRRDAGTLHRTTSGTPNNLGSGRGIKWLHRPSATDE